MSEAETKADPELVEFTIDGATIQGKPGQTVLEAGLDHGVLIPHYCWHPALSISGNCRMCLVHQKGAPKPVIACQTEIRAGMEIEAFTEAANATREGVMELLLINHPLDCPVCDQAGECDLQEYSYKHGRGESRFDEPKNQKPNKELGELVRFYGNRCILCSRCVRFCDEVTGTSELTIRERGDHNYIDTFPGYPLDNPLSLCTTDLCPVGALLDRDFIHKARVWNLTPTKTVCAGCATGCNTTAQSWDNKLQRLVPRENQAVNKWWMCDEGRLLYHPAVDAEGRNWDATRLAERDADADGETIIRTALSPREAIAELAEAWMAAGEGGVGVILTGWATNEEAALAVSLLRGHKDKVLGAEGLNLGVAYAPMGVEWQAQDGFTISKDKNPNRAGLTRILGEAYGQGMGHGLEALAEKIAAGDIKVLLVLDAMPAGSLTLPKALEESLSKLEMLAVFEQGKGGRFEDKAHLRLAAATFLEKDGTFVNGAGRVQRLRPAQMPTGQQRWELDLLQELGVALGSMDRNVSAASVFRRLAKAASSPFAGLDYNAIGEHGRRLDDPQAEERVTTGYESGPVSRGRYAESAVAEMIRVSVHRGG